MTRPTTFPLQNSSSVSDGVWARMKTDIDSVRGSTLPMTTLLVVVHGVIAMVPVLLLHCAYTGLVRLSFEYWLGYGSAIACAIVALLPAAWFPFAVVVAVRNARYAPGDTPRDRRPLHPVGVVTGTGIWGYIALGFASMIWQQDLGWARLILLAVLAASSLMLAWFYVKGGHPVGQVGGLRG